MNNLVLQKLLHAHQLVKIPKEADKDSYDRVDTPEARMLEKIFYAPTYFTGLKNTKNAYDKDAETIPSNVMKGALQGFAQSVSLAAKFYIDKRGTEFLTEKEFHTIERDLHVYAPYKNTFLQIEDDDYVYNILCFDRGDTTGDSEEPVLHMIMCPYDKTVDAFYFDLNAYSFAYHADTSFTFWLCDSPLSKYVDISCNDAGQYTNTALNDYVNTISAGWITLMILLQYPQIADTKNVKGRKNMFLDIATKFTTSTLRNKPNFEHKELKINMYGNAPTQSNNNNSNNRSIGTAFHSVRKHLRKLSNGKHTFVKAHFRGAKEHGVVSKDYVINANSL